MKKYTFYTLNFRRMRPKFQIIIRKKEKDHCKIKVQSQHVEELGRTVDSPMKWVDDEFVDPT